MKAGILTSAYAPAPGGAASYARVLSTHLAKASEIDSVQVFTEKFPGEPEEYTSDDKKLFVHRRFPWRAGREVKDWRSYVHYARQNLAFSRIDRWLPGDIDVLLVHAHLHYHPNLLSSGLKKLRENRGKNIRLILDVRDPLMPPERKRCTELYDEIICCSGNCLSHLHDTLGIQQTAHLIPTPVEPVLLTSAEVDHVLEAHDLGETKYLFGTNGISFAKGVDLCLSVTERLRERDQDLIFVVAGRCRDWGEPFATAERLGILKYVGALPQRHILALAARSVMHLNPSPIEGLPRASLEAMAMGARVLLSPNVPEFEQQAPQLVARSQDPDDLADQVLDILRSPDKECPYPITRHYIENLIPAYLNVFSGKGEAPRLSGVS